MSRSTWTCSLSAFWPLVVLLFLIFSVRLLFALARDTSAAEGFSEEEVRFESGDVTLQGTVLVSHEAL